MSLCDFWQLFTCQGILDHGSELQVCEVGMRDTEFVVHPAKEAAKDNFLGAKVTPQRSRSTEEGSERSRIASGPRETALHAASRCGLREVVKALLEGKANPLQRNAQGDLPHAVAQRAGRPECAELLKVLAPQESASGPVELLDEEEAEQAKLSRWGGVCIETRTRPVFSQIARAREKRREKKSRQREKRAGTPDQEKSEKAGKSYVEKELTGEALQKRVTELRREKARTAQKAKHLARRAEEETAKEQQCSSQLQELRRRSQELKSMFQQKKAEAEKAEAAARVAEEKVNALVHQRSEIHEEVAQQKQELQAMKHTVLMRLATLLCMVTPCSAAPYAKMPLLMPSARFELRDGHSMPVVGLGVYMSKPGKETYDAVKWALEAGYRMIDTAAIYQNEDSVGEAIADSGVPRNDIFLTTKLWDADHGYDAAEAFAMTFYDIDQGFSNTGIEEVTIQGDWTVAIHSPHFRRIQFRSTLAGMAMDSPTDARILTEDQFHKAVTIRFNEVDAFQVSLGVLSTGAHHRFFEFLGEASLLCAHLPEGGPAPAPPGLIPKRPFETVALTHEQWVFEGWEVKEEDPVVIGDAVLHGKHVVGADELRHDQTLRCTAKGTVRKVLPSLGRDTRNVDVGETLLPDLGVAIIAFPIVRPPGLVERPQKYDFFVVTERTYRFNLFQVHPGEHVVMGQALFDGKPVIGAPGTTRSRSRLARLLSHPRFMEKGQIIEMGVGVARITVEVTTTSYNASAAQIQGSEDCRLFLSKGPAATLHPDHRSTSSSSTGGGLCVDI
eukprot:g26479.t1